MLALAASIYCQDLSANGEAAVNASDKLVVGEVGGRALILILFFFFSPVLSEARRV